MDETTPGIEEDKGDPDRIKQDIDGIRRNLGGLVAELDRRRHEAFDIRLQLRRHAVPLAIGALALAAVVGTTIAIVIHQRRERHRLAARLRRLPPRLRQLRLALSRALAEPDRVAANEPRLSTKVLTAGGTATAATLGKQLATRLLR
ncbi:MAG TPA: hypothetical protein VFH73_23990 [Polyangia bacterium]|jgi:hypothetical protein|nr:hypothetical protein [Polyangia bacterium]